jgi:hypothetical protein
VKDDIIAFRYQIFEKLNYLQCFDLSDEEYIQLTRKLYEFALKGEFNLQEYVTVFHFLTRFGNPLEFDVTELEDSLISGMEKGVENYKYMPDLDFHLSIGDTAEYKENLNGIKKRALELNREIEKNNLANEKEKFEELCYTNFELFFEKILDPTQKQYFEPVLSEFDSNKFFKFFQNQLHLRTPIQRLIVTRYQHRHTLLRPEITFLMGLLEEAEQVESSKLGRNVSGQIIRNLITYLRAAIDNLS